MPDRDLAYVYCPTCWWRTRVVVWDNRQFGERHQCCPMCGTTTRITEVGSAAQADEPATPPHRWYPEATPTWRHWHGWPPGDLAIQEARAELLRRCWPGWEFRVVMALGGEHDH